MEDVDAVVIGGGPAGLLARHLLASHGLDAICIEPRAGVPSCSSEHVHFFNPRSFDAIERWVPGFHAKLNEAGAIRRNREVITAEARGYHLFPTRALFDEVLFDLIGRGPEQIVAKAMQFTWTRDAWKTSCDDGRQFRSRLLIDASGRTRRTFRTLSRLGGQAVDLHLGPATGRYLSAIVGGLIVDPDRVVIRHRGSGTTPGLLGLRVGRNRWQITLQLSIDAGRPGWTAAVDSLSVPLRRLFARHQLITAPRRFGEIRSTLADIDGDQIPAGWLPIGDALLSTPPYQGNGITNLVEHVAALDDGLRQLCPFEAIQEQVLDLASSAWLKATLLDSLTAPNAVPSQSALQQTA